MDQPSDGLSEVLAALEPLLADAIRHGTTRLPPERELARRLGIPRGRLRQALNHLQRRGAIFRRHGQGTFVVPPPHPDRARHRLLAGKVSLGELMDVRLQIEPRLAELAALRAGAEDLEQLEALMRNTREMQTPRTYDLADEVFHYRIAELAGNALFLEIYDMIGALRREAGWQERREETHIPAVIAVLSDQHQRIFEAIARHDAQDAGAELRQHLAHVAHMIQPQQQGA